MKGVTACHQCEKCDVALQEVGKRRHTAPERGGCHNRSRKEGLKAKGGGISLQFTRKGSEHAGP